MLCNVIYKPQYTPSLPPHIVITDDRQVSEPTEGGAVSVHSVAGPRGPGVCHSDALLPSTCGLRAQVCEGAHVGALQVCVCVCLRVFLLRRVAGNVSIALCLLLLWWCLFVCDILYRVLSSRAT